MATELTKIIGVGGYIAGLLEGAGITSVEELMKVPHEDLTKIEGIGIIRADIILEAAADLINETIDPAPKAKKASQEKPGKKNKKGKKKKDKKKKKKKSKKTKRRRNPRTTSHYSSHLGYHP